MGRSRSPSRLHVEVLSNVAQKVGLCASGADLEPLLEYAGLVLRWNRSKRIVGCSRVEDLVGVHIADAMALAGRLRHSQQGQTLLDVGTGAGLPGLVVAMLLPELSVTLCEISEKRVAFLHHARRVLQAKVEIVHADVETMISDGRRFDHAVSRAVLEPSRWIELGMRCVPPEGLVWCMLSGAQQSGLAMRGEVFQYRVAGDRARVLLKVTATGLNPGI